MSEREADRVTAEYLMRKVEEQPAPKFLSSPPVQDGPEYVEPLRLIAGVLVFAVIVGLIFWGVQ